MIRHIPCDVLVVGASLGGVAAALAAARQGAHVCLVDRGTWFGGQLTSQGVCTPDDTLSVETVGSTLAYRTLRDATRDYYRNNYHLSALGSSLVPFIPGSCWVGYLSVEPRVAHNLLKAMLEGLSGLQLFMQTTVLRLEVQEEIIRQVAARDRRGNNYHFQPLMVLDATDLGDLLPLAGAEHRVGAESQAQTGEPDAPEEPHEDYIQPFTFPFALEFCPGENHTILPPYDYAELKATEGYHLLDGAITGMFKGKYPFWTYRRVLAADNFDDPRVPHDVSMINTNSIDYKLALLPGASIDDIHRARRASLGYVYWLQTECPREDEPNRRGYPELKLRKDFFGTYDGLAVDPYIRESRRIHALQTIVEQDIVQKDLRGKVHQSGPRARHFTNSCGVGDFFLDVHPGQVDVERFMLTRPYQIPVDALIPVRLQNLLAACKNIGTTHLTNGAYRVHPVEWNIGESAGLLAAFCVSRSIAPAVLHEHEARLRPYQRQLLAGGIPLYWWSDIPHGDPLFEATQMMGVMGFFNERLEDPVGSEQGESAPAEEQDLRFRPDAPLSNSALTRLSDKLGEPISLPSSDMKRGQVTEWLYSRLAL